MAYSVGANNVPVGHLIELTPPEGDVRLKGRESNRRSSSSSKLLDSIFGLSSVAKDDVEEVFGLRKSMDSKEKKTQVEVLTGQLISISEDAEDWTRLGSEARAVAVDIQRTAPRAKIAMSRVDKLVATDPLLQGYSPVPDGEDLISPFGAQPPAVANKAYSSSEEQQRKVNNAKLLDFSDCSEEGEDDPDDPETHIRKRVFQPRKPWDVQESDEEDEGEGDAFVDAQLEKAIQEFRNHQRLKEEEQKQALPQVKPQQAERGGELRQSCQRLSPLEEDVDLPDIFEPRGAGAPRKPKPAPRLSLCTPIKRIGVAAPAAAAAGAPTPARRALSTIKPPLVVRAVATPKPSFTQKLSADRFRVETVSKENSSATVRYPKAEPVLAKRRYSHSGGGPHPLPQQPVPPAARSMSTMSSSRRSIAGGGSLLPKLA